MRTGIILNIFRRVVKRVVDVILYGNFWIALAAVCMCWQSQWVVAGTLHTGFLEIFVFVATLFIYAIHRLFSLRTLNKASSGSGRFQTIARWQRYIEIYAYLSGAATFVCFLFLSRLVQWSVLLPGVISLLYVLPLMGSDRRMRDIHYVKIFLIALVWAWVTVYLPILEYRHELTLSSWGLVAERGFFIFALTLPFDIRDIKLDQDHQVKTLPMQLGVVSTQWLAFIALSIMMGIAVWNYTSAMYTLNELLGLTIAVLVAYLFIFFSNRNQHDYYFTGLLDGMMILQFILVVYSGG